MKPSTSSATGSSFRVVWRVLVTVGRALVVAEELARNRLRRSAGGIISAFELKVVGCDHTQAHVHTDWGKFTSTHSARKPCDGAHTHTRTRTRAHGIGTHTHTHTHAMHTLENA